MKALDAGAQHWCHPRLYEPFPVMVRGVDANGKSFEINTVLDNMSAKGLYVRLKRQVRRGVKLFMIVQLSTTPPGRRLGARVSGRSGRRMGYVVRALRWVVRHYVRLSTKVDLPVLPLARTEPGPSIAIHGVVICTEPQPNGMCGVAVKFTHYRFL